MKLYKLIFCTLMIWSAFILQSSAQFYYDDGRQLCGSDSLLAGTYNALGINPAQLGRARKTQTKVGLLQIGGSLYSNQLDLSNLMDLTFSDKQFSENPLAGLFSSQDPFQFDSRMEFNWISFSLASPKFGGVAATIQDRVQTYANIPQQLVDVLLNGENADIIQQNPLGLPLIGDGTQISYNHIRELSLGYGLTLLDLDGFKLSAGIGYHLLWGIGNFDMSINGSTVSNRASFSELYEFNYQNIDPSSEAFRRKVLDASGSGSAWDAGVVLDIGKKISLGLSILDVGQLNWKENITGGSADLTQLLDSIASGTISSYDFKAEADDILKILQFTDEATAFTSVLNSHIRGNVVLRPIKRLVLNADIVIPTSVNGDKAQLNYQEGTYAAGATLTVLPKVLYLSSGMYYSNRHATRVPLGLTIRIGSANMISISTTDIMTFLSNRTDPFASLSVAMVNVGF